MRISTLWRSATLSLLLVGFVASLVYAQERTVTGKVTSAEEGPLPGVNVILQGSSTGTVSDIDGNYSLVVPGPEAILVFSSIGYTTEAITVGNQTVVDVVLAQDITSLKEIVVTGYASQEKKDLTGAVGVVKPEELTAIPQGNIVNQMQGRVSGVTITQDARPGAGSTIRIRGISGFAGNDPLYVVDGVPVGDINNLNPEDVETISVLKDAGAASIYGSRASNGVVVVTTKKGKKGMSVNYNGYYGSQQAGKGPQDLLTSQEYADLTWQVLDDQYKDTDPPITHPIFGVYNPANPQPPTFPYWAAETDWWDEITDNAMIMNHDISLSGGNDDSKFYGSLGYFDQDGISLYNFYKRFSGRFNSEFKIKDRVTIGENFSFTQSSNNQVPNQAEDTPLMATYRLQSITPVIITEAIPNGTTHNFQPGDWGGTGISPGMGNFGNYVAARTRGKDNRGMDIRILGNVFADVKIIDGLNFRTSLGSAWNQWYWTNWTGSTYENSENRFTASYQEGSGYGTEWTWTNTLTFNKKYGDHSILAVGGYEAIKTGIGRDMSASRAGYFSEDYAYRTLSNGETISGAASSFWTPRSLVSTFIRADYNFKEKYYLSGTFRRDGSSVFGSENKYGIFPSVTAAWRISEEAFMSGVTFISDLKLRGGYGEMGNQGPVSPQNQYYLYGAGIGSANYDLGGTGNSSLQGFRPTTIGNVFTQWETNIYQNIGLDAGLFNNTVELVLEWYTRKSEDLLFNQELPAHYGAASVPQSNIAEMKNTGIDAQLIYRKNWSDFRFSANLQLTAYKNEIVRMADGVDFFDSGGSRIGPFNRSQVGQPTGAFFGYEVERLFQEADFNSSGKLVEGIPVQDGAGPGFLKYVNHDTEATVTAAGPDFGKQLINPADRTFIGSPHPDFTYGLNLDFGWKNFDLTAFFYGSQGNEIFNYNRWWTEFWPSFQGQKSSRMLYESWTPERTDAKVPRASQSSNFSTNTVSSSYYVEDGSFLRLRQVQLGYTFPKAQVGKVFENLRLYVQATNLFTITNYSGMNPEMARTGSSYDDNTFGKDEGNMPIPQTYLIGINMGF